MTPSFFPPEWAPAPWVATAFSAFLAAAVVTDLLLAKRYAGGRESRDGALWGALVLSLNGNLALLLVLSALGIGRIGWHSQALAAAGVALGVAGLALRYAAIATLGRLFTWRVTILDGHELVTRGVFGIVRHPSYTGGLLAGFGAILAMANWVSFLAFTATFVPLVLWRIALEERALERHFGEQYAAYRDKAAALVPGVF